MQIIHIHEPFYGAGSPKVYGWGGKIPGIGIAKKTVDEATISGEVIRVTIGKDPAVYWISPTKVISLAQMYNSVREVRFGNKVLVVPQNEFQKEEA